MFPAQTLTNDMQASAISAPLAWAAQLLTGETATAVAVLAVAGLGFAMLTGRLAWRRAGEVCLGIALVFGAPSLAGGLLGIGVSPQVDVGSAQSLRPAALPPPPPTNSDPYAGAALPQ